MKTEQILMCVLFVACAALTLGGLAMLLGADIPSVQLAHHAMHHLAPASTAAY